LAGPTVPLSAVLKMVEACGGRLRGTNHKIFLYHGTKSFVVDKGPGAISKTVHPDAFRRVEIKLAKVRKIAQNLELDPAGVEEHFPGLLK
jgi:hypothetical protein